MDGAWRPSTLDLDDNDSRRFPSLISIHLGLVLFDLTGEAANTLENRRNEARHAATADSDLRIC